MHMAGFSLWSQYMHNIESIWLLRSRFKQQTNTEILGLAIVHTFCLWFE